VAIIRSILFILISCFCFSCVNQSPEIQTKSARDSISSLVLDSLGEIAYDHFEAYKDNPEAFLMPLQDKVFTKDQADTYTWILINMGYNFQNHSRILTSSRYYEQALLQEQKIQSLSEDDKLTFLIKPLANNYSMLGDYKKSERLQLQAVKESKDSTLRASFLNNLLLMYLHSNQVNLAVQSGLEGLKLLNKPNYLHIHLYNGLAQAYQEKKQIDSSQYYNKQALKYSNKLAPNEQVNAAYIATLSQQINLQQLDEKRVDSKPLILKALQLEMQSFPNSRFREKADLFHKLGKNELSGGNKNTAIKSLWKAKDFLKGQVNDYGQSTYNLINIYRDLGTFYSKSSIDSCLYYYQLALQQDFAYQQNSSGKENHLSANMWNRTLMQEILDNLPDPKSLRQEQLFQLIWFIELSKGRLLWNDIIRSNDWQNDSLQVNTETQQLQTLYQQKDRLIDSNEIKETDQKINALLAKFELEEQYFLNRRKMPSFEKFLINLKSYKGQQYSYFIQLDHSISIFRIEGGQIQYFHLKDPEFIPDLLHFKKTYFSDSPQAFNSNPKKYFQSAKQLKQALLPMLASNKKQIKLSLDNELHVLPFDALSDEKEYLIQKHDIQYVPSLLAFDLFENRSFNNLTLNILFREKYNPPLVDLPFVHKEVQNLKEHYEAKLFNFKDLNPDSMAEIWNAKGIIHIAAHTIVEENGEAKLLLKQPISTDQLRYFSMQAPLVVLSACNTASGELLPSEGLASINRAFLSKGIPGVLATHWYANDAVMLDMTDKFYQQLWRTKSPVQALSNAKRQFLLEQDETMSNPWYWANMVYTGLDTTIDLQQATGLSPVYHWLAIIFTIILILYLFQRLRKTDLK